MRRAHHRRTAQERVTGRRSCRIVLGDVLAEHVVELRGRARTCTIGILVCSLLHSPKCAVCILPTYNMRTCKDLKQAGSFLEPDG